MRKNKDYYNKVYRVDKLITIGIIVGIIIAIAIGACWFLSMKGEPDPQEPISIWETEETEPETDSGEESRLDEERTEDENKQYLKVQFIDVGQGDATLVQHGKHAILIDTGSSESAMDILAYMKEQSVERLEYLILSHGHEDHMGRGVDILEQIEVDHVICDFGNQEGYVQRLENYLKDMETDVIVPEAGEEFQVGKFSFTVLMGRTEQLSSEEELEVTNVNNQSLAVKVLHGQNSFLLYGDGELAYEQYLIEQDIDVNSTVLKVPHHGAASSCSLEILEKINPRYAVISSAPQDAFGYPSNEALQRLALKQVTTFYTNKRGTITAFSDGNTLYWTTEK